jgi:hypothetical protein
MYEIKPCFRFLQNSQRMYFQAGFASADVRKIFTNKRFHYEVREIHVRPENKH